MRSSVLKIGLAVAAVATLVGGARADLRTTYSLGPTVFGGAATPSVRAIAVDENPGSAWYNYVFVADAGGPTTAPQRRVMIFRPNPLNQRDGASATYVDTGLTISVPDQTGGNGVQFAPFGVFVGPDDTVWVANYDDRTVESFGLPATVPASPTPPATTSLGSTVIQIKMADFDAAAIASANVTPAIANGSSPRAVYVNGPITNANVFLGNYDGTVRCGQRYTVTAPDGNTKGTAAHVWTKVVTSSVGPYGIAADTANNAYVPVRVAAGANTMIKFAPDGTQDTAFSAPLPAGYTDSPYQSDYFVADPTAPGGGYLYYSFRNGTTGGFVCLRYDLSGNYLDGFGAAGTTALANFTTLTIPGSTTEYFGVDDLGNVYARSVFGSNSGVQKVFKRPAFVAATGTTNSAGAAVKSSATAVDGVAYFGSDDGKLYAVKTSDGSPDPSFNGGSPLDVSAAIGATVKIQSRAAVYMIHPEATPVKNIYFTTDRGDVVKVKADGTGLVAYSAAATGAGNVATPAVTPDGTVYAALNTASGLQVVKLDENLANAVTSSVLGPTTGSITSPAVSGGNIYVGLVGSTVGDIAVLDSSLVPHSAGVASGEGVTAPPFVSGMAMYTGTLAGRFYKVNSTTLAPDAAFGAANTPATPGYANIGEPLPNSPFPSSTLVATGAFYTGSSTGKVWQIDATSGAFSTFFDTGDATAKIGGLVVTPSNTVAFGTAAGTTALTGAFYQVPLAAPTSPRVYAGFGAINTTPTLDRATKRFFIGSDDKNVYAPADLF